jgi:dUTPase
MEQTKARIRGFEPVSEAGLDKVHLTVNSFIKKGFKGIIYVNQNYKEPVRSTSKSGASDIFYTGEVPIVLLPNEKCFIITGVKAYMQDNEVLLEDVRSSQGLFSDLVLCNTIGVIDSDYYNNAGNEGNIGIALKNTGDKEVIINTGDAVCQLFFVPVLALDNPSKDVIRDGGYGSTTEENGGK